MNMEKESFYANDDAEVDDENYDTNSILPDSLSSSSAIAEAIVQVDQSKNLDFNSNTNNFVNDLQQDFQVLMSNRKNETNDFRLMIITLGLSLISIGILANLVFNLLVMLRKKKRQTCTTLIMFSMCFSYLIYLAFYSLKLSIYFNGDNITKYHIYDTIDNWTYGSFLCKFLSALPIAVKLISRLSILTIAFKRVVTLLICSSTSVSSSSSSVDCDYFNEEEIKFKEFFIKNSVKLKSSSKINENTFESSLNDADESSNHNIDSVTIQPNRKKFNKFNTIRKIFEWPIIFVIVALIWAISFFSSWPIYSMYKLNRPTGSTSENIEVFTSNTICDSVYSFPEDTKKVASIYLNYLIYALILPCSFILIFLLILYVLDSNFCNIVSDSSKSRHSNIKNSSGGVIVTTRGISSGSSTDSTSFDEVNSSSLTSGSNSGCYKIRSGKHNNLLLWLMFIIHLLSSLPQELYRYLQLKVDFDDENILDQYLTLILMQPLVKARPYYAMQLIYTSEFAIMPLLFLLFYLCSNSFCCSNKRRTESNELDVNIIKKISLCGRLRDIFYDIELSRPLSHHISESQKSLSRRLLNTSSNSSNSRKITHYPRQLHHHNKKRINTNTISNPLMNNNNSKIAFNKIQLSSHDDIQTSLNEALLAIKNHNLNIENKNASNNSNNCSVISNKLNFSQRKLSSSLKPTPFELANQSNNEQFSLNPTNNNSTKSNILHIIQHPSWRCNIKQQSVNNNNNKNNNTFSDENESSDSFQLPFNYAKTTSYNT